MNPIRWLLPSLLLVLAACSGGSAVVAHVNGVPIARSEVAALRSEASVSSEQFREDLFRVVALEAVSQAFEEEFGETVDEAEVAAAEEELRAEIEATQGVSVEEVLEAQGWTPAILRRVAFERAIRDALDEALGPRVEDPGQEELETAYLARLGEYSEVCARHILVETEPEAVEVMERLQGGEGFAGVADDVSLDAAAVEGDLGCRAASAYDPVFAEAVLAAPLDEPTGPVETQFGWHVVEVSSREVTPLEDVQEELSVQLREQSRLQALEEFVDGALREAEIEVDARYGTWALDPVPHIQAPAAAE